jgi:hypothetical protein
MMVPMDAITQSIHGLLVDEGFAIQELTMIRLGL